MVTEQTTRTDARQARTELWISLVLRIGVASSLALVFAGLAVTFFHHPQYLSSRDELGRLIAPGAAFPRLLADVYTGLVAFRGQALVAAGLLLLIATPILRVAISVVAFLDEKDWLFAAITATVLAVLLLSFWLGRVE